MNAYLDYAATTPLDGEVLEKMLPYLKENFGNPDSLHSFGRTAAHAVEEARDRVADILGVKSQEVYFTSGGTEADNWAVRCLGGGKALVSAIEHAALLEGAKYREGGFEVLPVSSRGVVELSEAEALLKEDTGLLAVMAVNNETGCVQPIKDLAGLCKRRGTLFFSDCVQAASTQELKGLAALVDALSLSSHKIYGPKGVGALVVKKGAKLTPLIAGGEQERSLRGGTLNVAGIVGFSYALEKVQKNLSEDDKKVAFYRSMFEAMLLSVLDGEIVIDGENRAPNISHITFRKGGTALLNRLDLAGVACSGGAACSAHSAPPSHVLLAMGRSVEDATSGIRFSFSPRTTEEEVITSAATVVKTYRAL